VLITFTEKCPEQSSKKETVADYASNWASNKRKKEIRKKCWSKKERV
jgi:hypothetical protein